MRENKIQSGEKEVRGELRIKQEVDSAGEEEEEERQNPVKGRPYAARPGDYCINTYTLSERSPDTIHPGCQ